MTPRIIKTEAEHEEALEYLRQLQGVPPGPERDREIELWALLADQYQRSRPRRNSNLLLASIVSAVKRSFVWTGSSKIYIEKPRDWRLWAFFAGSALLLYLRLLYHGSFFPPFFEGEEGKVLDTAKFTHDIVAQGQSWWECIKGGAIEYNKGYSWALVPFYAYFGYDVRLITYIVPIFFSIFCGAFFTIYRKVYPKSSLLSFVLVILFSVLCLSLRRFKWHSMAYLTAISVYLFFQPHFNNGASILRANRRIALSLFLFVLSCYLYFGCFLYAVPFFMLVVMFSSREQRRREILLACGGFVVFVAAFVTAYKTNDVWKWRMIDEFAYVKGDFTRRGLLERWWATRDFFFTLDLSVPYLILFVVGLVSSIYKISRGDKFALVNTTLLGFLWFFELTIQGLNNPDQLNWSMIPLLGLLLIGADEIFGALREHVRFGTFVGVILCAFVGWTELEHYLPLNRDTPYQPFVQPRNTMTQAALVLRMIRDDDTGSVQYYLPDPSIPKETGGFEYNVSLLRVDFQKALSKVIFFVSEEDLRQKLSTQKNARPAVIYTSVSYPETNDSRDSMNQPLLGHKPVIIHPFEKIYEIQFLVRKYQFRPGQQVSFSP